jgi:hypothetical protein
MLSKYDTEDLVNHITVLWGKTGNGHYTQKESMYFSLFKTLLPDFTGGTVLEIGPGTGKFAQMLFNHYKIQNYTILDLAKNIKDSKNTLKNHLFPTIVYQRYQITIVII